MVRGTHVTSQPGYSDAINHAFAFAAKHHDRQVRKGMKLLPYFTQPANIAVILTRYDRDEKTIVAGILHDVVQDSVREGVSREILEQRIGEKFGSDVLSIVLEATQRRNDDDGIELSSEEKKSDYLDRLGSAKEAALWVSAAEKLHNVNSLLSDLKRTLDPNSVWSRLSGGRAATVQWYRDVVNRFAEIGFNASIVDELALGVSALESRA
ncbi:MAG TPA: HD domain-containing protein [Gemmatimonadaceae bacterium]|nr:HD domain-containing protein [Gemmatimonadaceae bacterium]